MGPKPTGSDVCASERVVMGGMVGRLVIQPGNPWVQFHRLHRRRVAQLDSRAGVS